jgi:hypothetical protein
MIPTWRPITLRGLVALCDRGWHFHEDPDHRRRLVSPDGRPFDFRAQHGSRLQVRPSIDAAQLATGERPDV